VRHDPDPPGGGRGGQEKKQHTEQARPSKQGAADQRLVGDTFFLLQLFDSSGEFMGKTIQDLATHTDIIIMPISCPLTTL
jgi:hypothetical protein